MIILKLSAETTAYIENQHKKGLKSGFVPTMGALHEGHISLVRQARQENDLVICSIFVNPTQFNNRSDFEKYPITIEKDIDMLEAAGCDLLFLPSVDEIYPKDYKTKSYDLGYLETLLEGSYRPGHFQGVCQVVDRLLTIVPCTVLYLGRKDYQQCMVIQRMMTLRGFKAELRIGETIRETDGLAMSSRNMRLDGEQRIQALAIYESLIYIKKHIAPGNQDQLLTAAASILLAQGFRIDYIALTDPLLHPIETWDGQTGVVALIAAYLGEVRLIDNMKVA